MWLEGPLTKNLHTFPQRPCFLYGCFCSVNYELPIGDQSFVPGPRMRRLCSRIQSRSSAHVTIETGPLVLSVGDTSEKQLSCPQGQLESPQCVRLAHTSLPIMWARLLPSPSSRGSGHPSNRANRDTQDLAQQGPHQESSCLDAINYRVLIW